MNFGIFNGVVKTPDNTGNSNQEQNELIYVANITQVNTDEPKVHILRNALGFDIDWKRTEANKFVGTAPFKFPLNLTGLFLNRNESDMKLYRNNSSEIILECPDGKMNQTTIKVEIGKPVQGLFSQEFNDLFS